MINFKLIDQGIDTTPLLDRLTDNPNLWNQLDYRKRGDESAHHQVNDIIVRFDDPTNYTAGIHCIDYKYYNMLCPALDDLIKLAVDRAQGTKVGRSVITKIPPGKTVTPHIDTEASVNIYKRYHICLYGSAGNMFTSGNETVEMHTGEFWWFENKKVHSCINQGVEDRIHLIVDIA
jgi:hypothetical protein